jgi:hypothetical protein
MYGFSGYGTNSYATSRQTGIFGPVVRLVMRVLQNTYGIPQALMLRFPTRTLRSTYGIPQALMLRFRNSTLTNPQTNNTSLEL